MMIRKRTLNPTQMVAAGLLLMLSVSTANSISWADQTLRNLKRPMQVQLETPVQTANMTVGQPFAAKLTEPVHYKNMTLPAGTEFRGHISKFAHSKHFGRPGYAILQTDEAILPNGQTMQFDSDKYAPPNKALRNPNAETFWQSVGIQIPYTVASLGVTIPLHYGADVPWQPLILVGEGIRMLTGAVIGLFRPKFKNEPVPRKIALGALDGSGIPRVVQFIDVWPEPDYHAGDQAKLYLNPNGLHDLMQSNKTASLPGEKTSSGLSLATPLPLSAGKVK